MDEGWERKSCSVLLSVPPSSCLLVSLHFIPLFVEKEQIASSRSLTPCKRRQIL